MATNKEKKAELKQKVALNWLSLDFSRDPEEAAAMWGSIFGEHNSLLQAAIERNLDRYHKGIAEKVAEKTKSTVEQILDKEKRTEKQDNMLLRAYAKDMESRIHHYLSSRHHEAMQVLKVNELKGKPATLAKLAIQYFFASLPLDASGIIETGVLTEQEKKNLKEIYKRITAFEKTHTLKNLTRFFIDFIDSEMLEPAEIIERVKAIQADFLLQPVDKPNNRLWDMARDSAKHGGQLTLDISTQTDKDKKAGKDPIIYLALTFDDIPANVRITKELNAYDKRVYIAVGALWDAGNKIVTVSQIYHMMGNTKRPNSNDVKKINDSLTKMGFARLYINSEDESKIHKGYTGFKGDAPLLAFNRGAAFVNGQLVEAAIVLLDEPIMIKFPRERKQVEQIPLQLLMTPISQSNRNLEIEDYLLTRICRMKSPTGGTQRKILYESVFAYCRINTLSGKTKEKAKARTRETIDKLMAYYKETGFIKEYTVEAAGITVTP